MDFFYTFQRNIRDFLVKSNLTYLLFQTVKIQFLNIYKYVTTFFLKSNSSKILPKGLTCSIHVLVRNSVY